MAFKSHTLIPEYSRLVIRLRGMLVAAFHGFNHGQQPASSSSVIRLLTIS